MQVAKAKGHLRGKQPKLNPRQEAHLVKLLHSGQYSTAEVGDLFGVARSTVYRAVARSKTPAAAGRATTTAAPSSRALSGPSSKTGSLDTATGTYRPRHGAPSDVPSENRGRSHTRSVRPGNTPQTGH
jgi:Helix-turn-helix domain of resolvase